MLITLLHATVPAASVRRRLARKTGKTIAEQCGKDVQLFYKDQETSIDLANN
jgi:hypothetical protein